MAPPCRQVQAPAPAPTIRSDWPVPPPASPALDPTMTAALVNLANIHYARDRAVEAEALYEKALALEPASFEAQYNLGNVLHDTGRFEAAARCYRGALAVDPTYADAHFYLAVTLEKLARSADAKPHWVAYRRLAPNGEWVELAREFSE
jgi:tetratricopeptide (TPR) repeat protein